RVIAHVADAERAVLHFAVPGRDLEPVLLHCGRDLRSGDAIRTDDARHGGRAERGVLHEDLEAVLIAPRPRALRHRAMPREPRIETFLLDAVDLHLQRVQQRNRRRVRRLVLQDVALELEEVEVDAAVLLRARAVEYALLRDAERETGRQSERLLRPG